MPARLRILLNYKDHKTIEKFQKEQCRLRLLNKKLHLIVLTLRSDYDYYPGTDWPRLKLKSFEPEGKKESIHAHFLSLYGICDIMKVTTLLNSKSRLTIQITTNE